MKLSSVICAAVMMVFAVSGLARAGVTLDVVASSAPNAYGSPSWSGYCSNALYALENGLSVNGDRATTPTGYEAAPDEVDPWEIAVTSFKSWRGDVNPTGAFANELGNRMHFGLHAYGDGTSQFTLEDLTFSLHSSDTEDSLIYEGGFTGLSYTGTTRYGINWGDDRAKGGGDDTVYTSGNGTTLVDELVYVGVGNAWWPGGDDTTPATPEGGAQAAMDEYFSWVASEQPIDVTCTYSLGAFSGSDLVTVVPEPAGVVLLALGSLFLRRRRA